ncbi:mCG147376 [Mus musculus]|nr:mCG147376 [Mus musculus]
MRRLSPRPSYEAQPLLEAAREAPSRMPGQATPREAHVSRITSLRKLPKGAPMTAVLSWGNSGETQCCPPPSPSCPPDKESLE